MKKELKELMYLDLVDMYWQGGIIFLETASAVMFSQFGNSYIRRIRHLLHGRPSFQETLPAGNSANSTTWAIPENFTMDLSQFYLALFARDESGMTLSCYHIL